jgi:aspartate/methionine/tyrosine aminotransferase
MDSGMFLGFQKAASRALAADASWYESLRSTYAKRRQVGFEILQSLGCTPDADQQGMFVWAKVPEHVEDVSGWVDEILMKTAVFIVPGGIFGTRGVRYVRLSLCSPEGVLLEALNRIKKMK